MSFITLFVFSLAVMLSVIVAMAIGVIFGRPAIRGSCGGLNSEGGCALCSGECPKKRAAQIKSERD